jgi:diguanylate cyclase (GGDEF)-like protein
MDNEKHGSEPPHGVRPHWRTRAWLLRQVLGDEPQQRLRISRAFTSMLMYVLCLGLAEHALTHGMADPVATRLLQACMITWMVIVYATLRSGLSLRFRDPSLTFVQIMAAGAGITVAYVVFAPIRGALLMLLALTLAFSIFNLDRKGRRIYSGCVVVGTGLTMFTLSTLRPDDYPSQVEWVHFVLTAAVLAIMGRLSEQLQTIRARLRTQRNELEAALTHIQELATRDALTGLPNRRHATDLFAQMGRSAERTGAPLIVCLIDLDHFKRINDMFGHNAGDTVLKRFADIASGALRKSDLLARWGGEEFLVLLPDTPVQRADQSMARVRAALAQVRLVAAADACVVTFSAGLARFRPGESIEHAVERADFALYRAKSEGRNRCVISD